MNSTTYKNLITGEILKATKATSHGVDFEVIETGEWKFYTNHQISKFIRKNG